jgi:hypothetical protein
MHRLYRLTESDFSYCMLTVMRSPAADDKRRDAMAMAAAPYLHAKLSAIDAKLSPAATEPERGYVCNARAR